MAKTTQYQIQLKEEVTAALRNIEGKLATTNQKMGEMQKTGEKAFDTAKVAAYGAAAVAALGMIADFAGKAVKAYGDFEEKQLRLAAQLKVSGNQIGMTAGQIMNLASALEDATGIDDSNILDAISTMQTFQNVTGNTFKEAITQAANMSVVFGDVDTAAKALGKALDDPTNGLAALSKAGVRFNDAEKEQIELLQSSGNLLGAQTIILDKIKGKFDGLAESINVGMNGALKGLANVWDDTMKDMGAAAVDAYKPMIKWLTDTLREVRKSINKDYSVEELKREIADLDGYITRGGSKMTDTFNPLVRDRIALNNKLQAMLHATGSDLTGSGSATPLPALPSSRVESLGYESWSPDPLSTLGGMMPVGSTPIGTGLNLSLAQPVSTALQDELAAWATQTALMQEFYDSDEAAANEKAARDKKNADDLFATMGKGWAMVSGTFSLYAKLQEDATQANLDRMATELDEYTAAQDLKIEVAKRNGEDTGQMEVDKANEVYLQKKKLAEGERDAKRKAWEANRQASLTEAIMSGAVAGLDALKLLPNVPLAIAMGALAAGTTVANVSMIAGQKMPAFAQGGIVPGNLFTGDQVMARLNSGEGVLTARGIQNAGRLMSSGGTTIIIEKVYGTVDQEFLAALNRAQDVRDYRGIA